MKILILGVGGMAGHILYDYFRERPSYEVFGTVREVSSSPNVVRLNVLDNSEVVDTMRRLHPDVVINAVGLLNDNAAKHMKEAIYVNALFPHILTDIGRQIGCKIIHISTDCVFSGAVGNYKETDNSDGCSVYAKTKSLGEIIDESNVTIRTSIIGPEKKTNGIGLFHWFSQQKGKIRGYRHVLWNGVTTLELTKFIEWILENNTKGLVHFTAQTKISKYELLLMLKDIFGRNDVEIIPDDGPQSDKTLVNTRDDIAFAVQPYPQMIQEMKKWMKRA